MYAFSWLTGLVAMTLVCPTLQHYASRICKKEGQKDTVPIPDSDTLGESIEIAYECNKQRSKILSCTLPSGSPASTERVNQQPFVGKTGRKYTVCCSSYSAPNIQENTFASNVCATDAKARDVKMVDGDADKLINVKFACDLGNQRIRSCQPEGGKKVPADDEGEPALIDGPKGKSKYAFRCLETEKPKIQLTFAAKTCAKPDKPETFRATHVLDNIRTIVTFECADEATIKTCLPEKKKKPINAGKNGLFAGDGPMHWGGHKLFCSATDEPWIQAYSEIVAQRSEGN